MTQFDDAASTVANLPVGEISGDLVLALVSVKLYSIDSFKWLEDYSASILGTARVIRGPTPLIGKEFAIQIKHNSADGNRKRKSSFATIGTYGCSIYLFLRELEFNFVGNLMAANLLDDNVHIEIPFFPKERDSKKSWLPFKRKRPKRSDLKFAAIDHFSINRLNSNNK